MTEEDAGALAVEEGSGESDHDTRPDMGAVYILLGCLTLSGLVILAILAYCTSQCWRRKCFRSRKRNNVNVKLITSGDDGYRDLKHSRPKMNGKSVVHINSVSPVNEKLLSESNGNCRQLSAITSELDDEQQYTLKQFGSRPSADGEFEDDDGRNLFQNGEAQLWPIRHYDIGYEKSHNNCFRGTLTFALRYDYIHRVLMVHVLRACHLPTKEKATVSTDPYVKMYLLPDRRNHCKTRIHRKTLDPEFNEMFSFEATYQNLPNRMLQFTVYDFDRFSRHDLIGNVIMRDLFEKSDLYTWTEYTMQIIASNDKEDYGDVLMYLTYDKEDSRFTFQIAKAYNLRPMDITGASDPYVKIYQLLGRRRVKTKRTTTKRQNLNPVYNETLVFDVPEAQVASTNFLVKVMDWDRIGSDDLLGATVLGPDAVTAEGLDQWQLSIDSPGKLVGKWHALLADIPEQYTNLTKK